MTDRVIVTAVESLDEVLALLGRAAAGRGWRIDGPADAAGLQTRARAAIAQRRLPHPLVVRIVPDVGADVGADAVDAASLLRDAPIDGVVADTRRRLGHR